MILRWPVDVPRLVSNAVALLGPQEAGRRVAVLFERREGDREDPPQTIFMLKKRPWTEAETARIASWSQAQPVIVPGHHVEEPYASVFDGRTSFADYVAQAQTRVDPVYDDRPFFFANVKPWGLPKKMREQFVYVLDVLLPLGLLVVVLGKPRGERAAPYVASILYFASLGIGFIAVELALLQHLTLLLGHPIFTLSILLFTLLAAGGVGSWASGRFRAGYRLPRDRGGRGALRARAAARRAGAAAAGAARADRDRDAARGPARLPDGDAFPEGAARDGQRPVPRATSLLGHERPLLGRRLDGDDGDRRDLRLHLGDARRSLVLPGGRGQLARAERSPARSVIR